MPSGDAAAHHARRRPRAIAAVALSTVAAATIGIVIGSGFLSGGGDASPADAPAAAPAATSQATPSQATEPIVAPEVAGATAGPQVSVSPSLDLDQHSIDDPGSIWVVVNKHRPLDPIRYEPEELVSVGSGTQMTPEAASAFGALREAAADAGAGFSTSTAYRSHGFQAGLHADYVAKWGAARADDFSARPGYSEHQTGLAVDVYESAACRLKACFADETAGRWLAAHAHEHGFIVRYAEGAEDITGYRYEPWHLRYVGVELAAFMREQGIATLEEVFGVDPAPDFP
ncbi:M15 family metallopeptidase [uncultured Demequina sp.]|uniref:M15 family metallopeptidase n=1 Tax=uncultured Demequina sp. TaxID=693499 RepID=UPI0025F52C57|nr:M15 family metallopeptidase [uncultured Demequina sp.]